METLGSGYCTLAGILGFGVVGKRTAPPGQESEWDNLLETAYSRVVLTVTKSERHVELEHVERGW